MLVPDLSSETEGSGWIVGTALDIERNGITVIGVVLTARQTALSGSGSAPLDAYLGNGDLLRQQWSTLNLDRQREPSRVGDQRPGIGVFRRVESRGLECADRRRQGDARRTGERPT